MFARHRGAAASLPALLVPACWIPCIRRVVSPRARGKRGVGSGVWSVLYPMQALWERRMQNYGEGACTWFVQRDGELLQPWRVDTALRGNLADQWVLHQRKSQRAKCLRSPRHAASLCGAAIAPTTAQVYYSALYEHFACCTVCVHYFIYTHRCILYPYIQKSTWHSDAHLPHHFIPTVAFCRDICWTPPRSQRSVFLHPRPRGQGATRKRTAPLHGADIL